MQALTRPSERRGPYSGTVLSKLRVLAEEPASVELIFVHRDADASDDQPRHDEVSAAVETADLNIPVIALVPVQELEAWLLVDEAAIRTVVGCPRVRAVQITDPRAQRRLAGY